MGIVLMARKPLRCSGASLLQIREIAMLATNFRTAAELGITTKDYEALLMTLRYFETNDVPYHDIIDFWVQNKPTGFNMRAVRARASCGTVACLCGWARQLADDEDLLKDRTEGLNKLFLFGSVDVGGAARIVDIYQQAYHATPAQATVALRNYLTTGEPNWQDALTVA
jgi:hypothetical protein